ncbi:MAG TPA: 50S ribosomal protein L30 [Candidatus Limnocylindrales bacterium]|jgi:large subunit ribosomal protein L30|nr:50S ribosomal protein L30 [Candidatus Limnocylindrales bacterium]
MAAKLRVTLVKSPIGHTARTRGTLRALGLRRIGQTVEVSDNDQMRGLARTVRFLLQTEETGASEQATAEGEPRTEPRPRARAAQAKADPGQAPAEASAAPAEESFPAAKPKRAPRAKKESDE